MPRTEVLSALEEQIEARQETRLGEILVRRGTLSREKLGMALEAQESLRSPNAEERTRGAVKLAGLSATTTVERAEDMEKKSATLFSIAGGTPGRAAIK